MEGSSDMAPFILIPDTRWGKSSASGTGRFAPGVKSARCPINRRLRGQRGGYGSFGEKKILAFIMEPNQEPRFSSQVPSYNID
jgi:hypothetical protein